MPSLSNAEIAKVLLSLAQILAVQKENPFKIKAYRRAAKAISNLSDSVEELVRTNTDLTTIPGIGASISGAIREIVERGGALEQLDKLRTSAGPTAASLTDYPLLDTKRVERVYKKLNISSVAELKERLESGEINSQLGVHMERHIRQGLIAATEILLYDAHKLVPGIEEFLRDKGNAERAEAAGDFRRRVEVIRELSFVVQTDDFDNLVQAFQRFGGRTSLLTSDANTAEFQLPVGVPVRISNTTAKLWGLTLLIATGSEAHLSKLLKRGFNLEALAEGKASRTEEAIYRKLGLQLVPAELREGRDEIKLVAAGQLPRLITKADIRGELHAHTTSSDGAYTVEQMAAAARERGYEYLGITDHSQSLTIANGVSESDLWKQIRHIDKLNESGSSKGIRILKSAEVDILADGSLDYPDSLLKELDYTVCSIHSRFALSKTVQTERILRAMDNRYFNILGHATGRRLLKRPGYEIDFDRVVEHARKSDCFFEINSSPERLDLSAENARKAREAGLMIAINTDAHSIREFNFIEGGVEQARRAGLDKSSILNCLPWSKLQHVLRR